MRPQLTHLQIWRKLITGSRSHQVFLLFSQLGSMVPGIEWKRCSFRGSGKLMWLVPSEPGDGELRWLVLSQGTTNGLASLLTCSLSGSPAHYASHYRVGVLFIAFRWVSSKTLWSRYVLSRAVGVYGYCRLLQFQPRFSLLVANVHYEAASLLLMLCREAIFSSRRAMETMQRN